MLDVCLYVYTGLGIFVTKAYKFCCCCIITDSYVRCDKYIQI